MFRDSYNGIEGYTTSVIGFISKCIDDIVPTVTVRKYPNQKPWITDNICPKLNARAATFKERDSNPEAYKKCRYALWRTIENRQIVNTELRLNAVNKSMRWPAGKCLHWYFQPLPDPVCNTVPTCFKQTTIVPVPKKVKVTCQNY